jgi:hypothetical protein
MHSRSITLLAGIAVFAVSVQGQDPSLRVLGTYRSGAYNAGAAEIVAHDPATQRLFVVNGADKKVDVLDMRNPAQLTRIRQLEIPAAHGAAANSVAVRNGIVAVAVEADPRTEPGSVVFFTTDGAFVNAVKVGALPDMITFTPDGKKVLTANEGEPSDDYMADPEGTVSIINVDKPIAAITQADVRTAGFSQYTASTLPPGIRVYGPRASVAQDFEPEYVAVSADSKTAYVTLQENNALAIIDIDTARVTGLRALGLKEYWRAENSLDASDRDGVARLRTWTVWGMYQPDAIVSWVGPDGKQYLITANEGDARAYTAFNEEARVSELKLDPAMYPNAADVQRAEEMGRLRVTNATGDLDGDGDIDMLHSFGARSFSIWNADGQMVFDSMNHLELINLSNLGQAFNVSNSDNAFDSRSDDKGPEPEGLAVGRVRGKDYLFVANERQSNIVIYELADPGNPRYVAQFVNRDYAAATNTAAAGDLGPEGIAFVSERDSPTGKALILVANETSGTTTVWEVQ